MEGVRVCHVTWSIASEKTDGEKWRGRCAEAISQWSSPPPPPPRHTHAHRLTDSSSVMSLVTASPYVFVVLPCVDCFAPGMHGCKVFAMSMSVCLPVRSHISKNSSRLNFTKMILRACGRGSVLLWLRCDTLSTSGFVDYVMF